MHRKKTEFTNTFDYKSDMIIKKDGYVMKYIAMIESFYPSLSKTEKKIADYMIEEKGKIIYQTLLEISKNIHVGEASIMRFVRKIGYNGFQDLKLEIAKEDRPQEQETYEHYIDEVAGNMVNTIANTKTVLDPKQLNIAIDLIVHAQRLMYYGVGSSGLAASELQNRLMRLGKIGVSVSDSHFQLMHSSVSGEKDVIIALSLSGYTEDIIDSLRLAKKNKAKIIAITNYVLSPVAQLADSVLLTAGKENPLDGGSLVAKISQLYIIDLLCTGYAIKNKEVAYELKGRTAQAVTKKSANKSIDN